MRSWVAEKLLSQFGSEWFSRIPEGVREKTREKLPYSSPEEADDPMILLEETDLPDLMEIVCYKKGFAGFVPLDAMPLEEFRDKVLKLYQIRCKIAHVKRDFCAIDLDLLIEIAEDFLPIVATGSSLQEVLDCIKTNPERAVIQIPSSFFVDDEPSSFAPHITNLPPGDYDPDGGFIGRQEDLNRILKLILGGVHRIVTISGAGGVGKTAIAHQTCKNLLMRPNLPFDGIIWVSAKEEKLTVTGIEPIRPTLRNYESLIDSILETFGWRDDLDKPFEEKEESVHVILGASDKGILLVVDNLETIQDARVVEFIKDFPPPSKVLITSRIGLGEVERRYPLKEMNAKDAIVLLRTIAREKGAESFAKLPDDVLSKCVDKMSRYPLAIKWVVGQVALGKDVDTAIYDLTLPAGDVVRFCFEHIFDRFLKDDARLILYSLAAYDKPLGRGVLSHISNLPAEQLESALKDLTIASLIIPTQVKSSDESIETRYDLLPLTRKYVHAKLQSIPERSREIRNRVERVGDLIEEAGRAGKQYRYSLSYMGAESEEEKIAATWAFTAYQKFQAGDYDGAIAGFEKAVQIAPKFPAVYRNWAAMESGAGDHIKADALMRQATAINANDSSLWFFWGNMMKRRQKFDHAYNYLKKALDLSPKDAVILGALGEVEKRRGNYENADRLLRQALEGSFEGSPVRHQTICLTSLADNLQRWAETLLGDKRAKESLNKLIEAYKLAKQAAALEKDDTQAQDTLREISLSLAIQLQRSEGLDRARPYFEESIVHNPKGAKEKKATTVACYRLAYALIKQGKQEEAEKYINLGLKCLVRGSKYEEKYRDLSSEFAGERFRGKLIRVVQGHGFGFIELEGETGNTLFVHISQFSPEVSIEEFEKMQGCTFSFLVEKTQKGPEAKRVRRIT